MKKTWMLLVLQVGCGLGTDLFGGPDGGSKDGAMNLDGGAGDDGGTVIEPKFSALFADYLGTCADCHAPSAPGRTSNIEQTLNFSTKALAYQTLVMGQAAGLSGNTSACNGIDFVGSTPEKSLLVAVLDQTVRQSFSDSSFPGCDSVAISDEAAKVGSDPSNTFLTALSEWITLGAPNN